MTSLVHDVTRRALFFNFLLWAGTSFMCHKLAKEFLNQSKAQLSVTSPEGSTTSSDVMPTALPCGLAMAVTVVQVGLP